MDVEEQKNEDADVTHLAKLGAGDKSVWQRRRAQIRSWRRDRNLELNSLRAFLVLGSWRPTGPGPVYHSPSGPQGGRERGVFASTCGGGARVGISAPAGDRDR